MKALSRFTLLYSLFISTGHAEEIRLEHDQYTYTADTASGALTIQWTGGQIKLNDIIGTYGQTYTTLINFNNKPALYYSNTASSTSFDIYYTLHGKNNEIYLDCIYADINSHINGLTTRKAVCGINEKLRDDVQDKVYAYTDKWIARADKENLTGLFENPESSIKVLIGKINDSFIYSSYTSLTDLLERSPTTLVVDNGAITDLGKKRSFLIYSPKNLETAISLEQEVSPNEPFKMIIRSRN